MSTPVTLRTLFPLVILVSGGVAFAQSVEPPSTLVNRKSVFSGTINSTLPTKEVPGAPKKVFFPLPNTIMMSGTKYCGDGDVAAFKSRNNLDFFASGATAAPVVLGYFVVADGDQTSPTVKPTNALVSKEFTQGNYFMIGWRDDLPIDSGVVHRVFAANNKSTPDRSAFQLVKTTLESLRDMATQDAKYLSDTRKYRVVLNAMTCPGPLPNTDGTTEDNGATAIAVTRQFLSGTDLIDGGTPKSLNDFIGAGLTDTTPNAQGDAFLDSLRSIKVVPRADNAGRPGIRIQAGASDGTKSIIATEAFNFLKGVVDLPQPTVETKAVAISTGGTCPCSELHYTDQMEAHSTFRTADGISSQLANYARPDSGCTLSGGPLKVDFAETKPFLWEPYPTNASCTYSKRAASEFSSGLRNEVKKLYSDTSFNSKTVCPAVTNAAGCAAFPKASDLGPKPDEFRKMKNSVAKLSAQLIFAPAVINAAERDLEAKVKDRSIKMNLASCLPKSNTGGLNYIRKVGGSFNLPLGLSKKGNKREIKDPGRMSHPEGDFAMGSSASYAGPTGDHKTIFNNGGSTVTDFVIGNGVAPTEPLDSPGVHIDFNIRALGCSQNVYCANEKPPILSPLALPPEMQVPAASGKRDEI